MNRIAPSREVSDPSILLVRLTSHDGRLLDPSCSEMDPAYALLFESVSKDNATVRIGAIMGLGIAYAGTGRTEIKARSGSTSQPL